jgi:hypothetical protein
LGWQHVSTLIPEDDADRRPRTLDDCEGNLREWSRASLSLPSRKAEPLAVSPAEAAAGVGKTENGHFVLGARAKGMRRKRAIQINDRDWLMKP